MSLINVVSEDNCVEVLIGDLVFNFRRVLLFLANMICFWKEG